MGNANRWIVGIGIVAAAGLLAVWALGEAQDTRARKAPAVATTAQQATAIAPPIGKPRTDQEFSKDIGDLLFDRRVAVSDLPGGLAFKPKDCMRCHENEPGVEGQIFYGTPDFGKDVNWPNYIGHPEKKHAPSLKYNFFETHKRKAKLTPKGGVEQRLKQNQ